VNLRHTFFSKGVLQDSLRLAHVVKLNDQELPRLAELLSLAGSSEEERARRLLEIYDLRLVCITRGAHGSLLVSKGESAAHEGFRVRVADTVGAGDAFTAALVHHYLRGASLLEINERANRVAAWVATQAGGTPSTGAHNLDEILAMIAA
jgi:fructokinase